MKPTRKQFYFAFVILERSEESLNSRSRTTAACNSRYLNSIDE